MFILYKSLSESLKLSKILNLIPALTLNLLKGILERSKISFNPSFAKASEGRRVFTPEPSRRVRTSAHGFGPLNNYYWIISLFIFVGNTQCLIVESDTLETVLEYISTPNTLVIFDIDNTLAHPATELSSDEWFCYLVNTKMAQGHDYITSIYYALPVTYYAQFNVDLEPTEWIAPFLLEQLIAQSIPIMALSTRSLFVAERTMEQLENINIHFLIPHLSQDELVLPMPYPCFYRDSILFGGNNDKGEALIAFFHWMNYYPDCVIFIDDKMKYLLAVEKALTHHGIQFIGIRYSGCDERIENFDPAKAEEQWNTLRYQKRESL